MSVKSVMSFPSNSWLKGERAELGWERSWDSLPGEPGTMSHEGVPKRGCRKPTSWRRGTMPRRWAWGEEGREKTPSGT